MTQRRFLIAALGVFAALSAADFALTRHLVDGSGAAYEANPVANWLLRRHGWDGLAFFKVAVALLVAGLAAAVYWYRPRAATRLLGFGCAALTIVVVYSGALAVARQTDGQDDPDVAGMMQEDERLNRAQESATEYRSVLERISARLQSGQMTLAAAVDQLSTTDKADDPEWLNALHYLYPGLSDRGCLAASLVQNILGSMEPSTPGARRTSRRLMKELYTLCGTNSPTSFEPILRRYSTGDAASN